MVFKRRSLSPRSLIASDDSIPISDPGVEPNSTSTLHTPFVGGPVPPKNSLEFLNTKAPANYVAGLGRGATGFTTRSDIGPACATPDLPDRSAITIGGAGVPRVGRRRVQGEGEEEEEEEEADNKGYDENQKFDDEYEGNDVRFVSAEFDEEADAMWEAIDERMDSRRKDRREARLKQEIEKYRASNINITEQFADLKRKLYTLPAQEWDSIPEIGDYYSLRNNKKNKCERDSLDPKNVTDLSALGKLLSLNSYRVSDPVTGLTVFNPMGYLIDLLRTLNITGGISIEISVIKKYRLLLKSFTQTNPTHPHGWIAAARLEEIAGQIQAARQLIKKGCEECPKNDGVWLDMCRLASPDEAKAVIAKGLKAIPNSVKLWMEAAKLEDDEDNKNRILRMGLEHIPDSVWLWKAVVKLANEEDARLLLQRAVQCCPLNVDLWLALVRLETYDKAKRVLNKAREKLPKEELAIWITAAKLEEANGNTAMVEKIIERGIKTLQREGLVIDREAWMKEAEAAERVASSICCLSAKSMDAIKKMPP